MESWKQELYHHGVLGMKWGVRRTPAQLGHIKKAAGSAGKSFQKTVLQQTSKKAVDRVYKTGKKEKPAKVAKEILKKGAMGASATLLTTALMAVSNKAIKNGKSFVESHLSRDAIDIMLAKRYGTY